MRQEWKRPELEVLDIGMTMKFWPPKDPGAGPEPGADPDPGIDPNPGLIS